jgi:hypothetical protein
MSSNDDRQTKTQRDLTPTHILERAIDQLPPDERGRAREALAELEGRESDARERLKVQARNFDQLISYWEKRRARTADDWEELTDATDGVVEAAEALLAGDDAVAIIRKSQGLRGAIEQYQKVREAPDE